MLLKCHASRYYTPKSVGNVSVVRNHKVCMLKLCQLQLFKKRAFLECTVRSHRAHITLTVYNQADRLPSGDLLS